jgi:predicted SAM-dependent methyltransferase
MATTADPTEVRGAKLHLGCGSIVVDGWINIDNSPGVILARAPFVKRGLRRVGVLTQEQEDAEFPAGIVRVDLRGGLPYRDGSADAIYSSHLIEHLARWQALALLQDCARVLASGGVIRLATPDLGGIVTDYVSGDTRYGPTPADSMMEQLLTFSEHRGTRMQRLVRRLVTAPHQWLYDEVSLGALLREAGFSDPVRRDYRVGDLPDLERIEHRNEGLIVEARR